MADQLNSLFFDVEKFFASVACQRMSFLEKGVYLTMLFQQWRSPERNLPDDPQAVAELIAVTPAQATEVVAAWEAVRRKFVTSDHTPGRIWNVKIEATRRKQRENLRKVRAAGRLGGKASAAKRQAPQELMVKHRLSGAAAVLNDRQPLDQIGGDQIGGEKKGGATGAVTARSKRPIFTGQRLTVFDWMLDDLTRMLGAHTDAFDLHEWFFTLDARAMQTGEVIPPRDGGTWLLGQTLAEAQRRGLPIASGGGVSTNKRIAGLVAGGQAFLNRTRS